MAASTKTGNEKIEAVGLNQDGFVSVAYKYRNCASHPTCAIDF